MTFLPASDPMAVDRWQKDIERRMSLVERDVRALEDGRDYQPVLDELAVLKTLIQEKPATGAGENRQLTMRDFWIAMGGLGAGATLAIRFLLHP